MDTVLNRILDLLLQHVQLGYLSIVLGFIAWVKYSYEPNERNKMHVFENADKLTNERVDRLELAMAKRMDDELVIFKDFNITLKDLTVAVGEIKLVLVREHLTRLDIDKGEWEYLSSMIGTEFDVQVNYFADQLIENLDNPEQAFKNAASFSLGRKKDVDTTMMELGVPVGMTRAVEEANEMSTGYNKALSVGLMDIAKNSQLSDKEKISIISSQAEIVKTNMRSRWKDNLTKIVNFKN